LQSWNLYLHILNLSCNLIHLPIIMYIWLDLDCFFVLLLLVWIIPILEITTLLVSQILMVSQSLSVLLSIYLSIYVSVVRKTILNSMSCNTSNSEAKCELVFRTLYSRYWIKMISHSGYYINQYVLYSSAIDCSGTPLHNITLINHYWRFRLSSNICFHTIE